MKKIAAKYLIVSTQLYNYSVNPFLLSDLFWYPLKTSENQRISDIFREYQKKTNGIKWINLFHATGLFQKITKNLIFLCFQRVQKETSSMIWVTETFKKPEQLISWELCFIVNHVAEWKNYWNLFLFHQSYLNV